MVANEIEALALKALDCLSQRSVITAQNIANAGTRGYRPLQVTFEEQLRLAASSGADAVDNVSPAIRPAVLPPGTSDMRLDLELATAAGTAGRYAALVEILNRHMQLGSLALSEMR